MDYASEQEMELEALQAILMDDLIEYEGNLPSGWVTTGTTYKVIIAPEDEEDSEYPLKAELLFAHTPNYPEEPPSFKLRSVTGLSDADLAEATGLLEEQVQSNLGMAMIYTLIGAAKEWIQGGAAGARRQAARWTCRRMPCWQRGNLQHTCAGVRESHRAYQP